MTNESSATPSSDRPSDPSEESSPTSATHGPSRASRSTASASAPGPSPDPGSSPDPGPSPDQGPSPDPGPAKPPDPGGRVHAVVQEAGTDASRRALLDAVSVVLAREGLEGLSLRKVAAQAGLSHAAPGVLFGGRAAMLTAFAAEGFRALGHRMDQAERAASHGRDALAATGMAYVLFAVDEPVRFQVMFRPDCLLPRDPGYLQACRDAFLPLQRAIDRGMHDGWFPAGQAEDMLLTAWSVVHGLAMLWFSKHLAGRVRPEPEALARRVIAQFADMVSAGAPQPPPAPMPGPAVHEHGS